MSRTASSSSYLSDDDLLMPEATPESFHDCLAPSYHSSEDAYKQRKAMQEQLRKKAGAKCIVFAETKKKSVKK